MDHLPRQAPAAARLAGTQRLRWATFLVLSLLLAASLNSPTLKTVVCQWAVGHGLAKLYTIRIGHPLLHVGAFAIAGVLLYRAGPGGGKMTASTALLLTTAIGSEILQHLVYRIGVEWDDIAYDLAGIAIALLVSALPPAWKVDWFSPR